MFKNIIDKQTYVRYNNIRTYVWRGNYEKGQVSKNNYCFINHLLNNDAAYSKGAWQN